jgi:DNA replication factor GINS
MHLDNLRNLILNERESARLSEIAPDTYEAARKYLAELQVQVYASEDPLSEETRSLIEEIHSLRETIRELFQIRSRKILALAGARMETPVDREETRKMIPPEREMYRIILAALEDCRCTTTEGKPGSAGATGQDVFAEEPPRRESSPEAGNGQMVVRMLADVDAFLGVDGRIYTLKKEDVVTLPRINAEVLCDHNIALNIKPGS